MRREATVMNVRQNLGELLNQVQYRGDSVMVTKHGKPVAASSRIALYERIRRLRESFAILTNKLGQVKRTSPPRRPMPKSMPQSVASAVRAKRGRQFQAKTAILKDD